jgi:metallo-beta-lactamase family protein
MQEEDAAFKKKRHEREGRTGPHLETPLYTAQDAEKCLPLLKDVPYEEPLPLSERVTVCFHDAGHILGSAMIEITVQDENGPQNIIFSGDIGQWNNPFVNNPSVFDRADYVVMESTYGDRNHGSQEDIDEKLRNVIDSTVNAHGNVLIPAFVIERAQDLLYHLNRLTRGKKIPSVSTFLDSPMAIEITNIFQRCEEYLDKETKELFEQGQSPFDFPGLRLVESVEDSKMINSIKESAVIMAGSGMITGGRIKHHLAREITRPESTILFVGYQAAGTLGRQIQDGVSPVRVLGQSYPVRMKIDRIDGFSAHAGMDDLHRWLNNFKSPPKQVFLTHGEEESITSLENYLQSKGGWKVDAPTYLKEYSL